MINATGWPELLDGNVISAVYTMYNAPSPYGLAGWTVIILFLVYQFMLLLKTRDLTISWVTGVIFVSMYALSTFVKPITVPILFVILVFELGGILYYLIWKK